MNFESNTILKLFSLANKSYQIPVYQRAYSWDKDNWKTLYEDLEEQLKGQNNYFFGNILLETITKHKLYDIIDGQQRLTTITIVIRSLLDVIIDRIDKGEKIDIDINEKIKTYFINGSTYKFRPVEYDKACYDTIIVKGIKKYYATSPSQVRIIECKEYFHKQFLLLNSDILLKLLEKIEDSEITTIDLDGKKDSALMFELQNNRGKDLTNMERLKSYLMYQMYVHSEPYEIESNIEYISNIFKNIYILIYDIKNLNEDSILLYHCYAYIKVFNYRTLEDIKEVFKSSKDKVKWINDFCQELNTTFSSIKKLQINSSYYLNKLKKLEISAFIYPYIIKGYKYFGDDNLKLDKLFQILEIILFRNKLIGTKASINSRLNNSLNLFNGDLKELIANVTSSFKDEYYWNDEKVADVLNGYMYQNPVLHYLLWEYENSIQFKGYSIGNIIIKDEEIEHISPKKEKELERIELGYDIDVNGQYNEEFKKEYLNCLGNLMLISKSHNSSIGNIPFSLKLNSYNKTPLLKQQAEIKEFAEFIQNKPCWFKKSIDDRHNAILNFSLNRWSFDKIVL